MKSKYNGFSDEEIVKLRKYKIKPEVANKFSARFDAMDIDWLVKNGAKGEEVNKYREKIYGQDCRMLYEMNVPPEMINKMDERSARNMVAEIQAHYVESRTDGVKKLGMWNCIGTGSSAIILLRDENTAWKFSESLTREYALIKHVNEHSKSLNVIKAKKLHPKKRMFFDPNKQSFSGKKEDPAGAMELQYVRGDSLENVLKKETSLPPERVLKYSADILNGLLEMRSTGIYFHRDIRPANIIIDYDKNRALIIDLGIAVTYSDAEAADNRRYGPGDFLANDLVSLGQTTYKMCTGNHLFLNARNMDETIYANKIQDNRIKVYSDKELLQKYLNKVDKNIKDKDIAYLTKELLTAKPDDHEKIMKMIR